MTTPETSASARATKKRGPLSVLTVIALVFGLLGLSAAPAMAEDKSDDPAAGAGWLRLMHLSPDTAAAAVTITSVATGAKKTVSGVEFGDASDYFGVAPGNYVVSIAPDSGGDAMLERSITVEADKPVTMTVTGKDGKLATRVYNDELPKVPEGKAMVRLIQASSGQPEVTVHTGDGALVAENAETGQATDYAEVPAGDWPLELKAGDKTISTDVDLPDGATTTVLILDNAENTLTAKAVVDSEAARVAPEGGVDTGAAPAARQGGNTAALAGMCALGIAVVAASAVIARRRVTERA